MLLDWPGWRAAGIAFALGMGIALGQAPLDAWYLAVPALAGLIWWIVRFQGQAAVWVAWFGGAGHFAIALSWIVEPFLVDIAQYGWMAPFALLLMAFGMALFWAAAAGLSLRMPRALGFAVCLAAMELARGYVLTGFPWALPGHVWVGTPVAQGAALAGANGLTLLTALVAALPVAWRWRGSVVSAALLALAAGFGVWRLDQPVPVRPEAVMLRLVQPNAEQHLKWDADQAGVIFARALALTAAKPVPDLVIWPETSVPYLMNTSPEAMAAIAEAGNGAVVAVGVQRSEGWRGFNSLAVLGPGGVVTGLYDKHHLVPFGEYIPYGDVMMQWFGLRAFAAQEGNGYSAGPQAQVLDLGLKLGKVLPLICYEAVFPQDLRVDVRADWILQITNDAWFGKINGPYQHLAQARFRAIEQGLPLVRVANTGVTGVFDARGSLVKRLDFGVAAYLDAPLPGALPATPYARFGEGPLMVLLAGLAGGLMLAARRRSA